MSWAAAIPAAINAAASIGGSLLNRGSETRLDKQKRSLIDDLLASLKGQGSFNDLFSTDEAAFQKGVVDPYMSRFNNQIAPQIQQQYISNGQQNSSSLQDTLTRAGVDLNSLINEKYLDFRNQGQNRQSNAISNILGQSGLSSNQSLGSAAAEGTSGYLSSNGARDDIGNILNSFKNRPPGGANSLNDTFKPPRKGFERDQQIYDPYTGIQQ